MNNASSYVLTSFFILMIVIVLSVTVTRRYQNEIYDYKKIIDCQGKVIEDLMNKIDEVLDLAINNQREKK